MKATSPHTRLLRENNPGPFSLDGTNTWIIQAPSAAGVIVVDPGQLTVTEHSREIARDNPAFTHDERDFRTHLDTLAGLPVELILLTHHHEDHAEAAPELARRTGAPVRALRPELVIDSTPLEDGEEIRAAGVTLRVIHTPGHSADSLSFHLPEDGPAGSMLSGDTILGRGTTVLGPEQNALGAFLDSIHALRNYGDATVLTGHAAVLPSVAAVSDEYITHRTQRLEQVRAALATLGRDATAEQIVDLVYTDIGPLLRRGAVSSVTAQLEYLRS